MEPIQNGPASFSPARGVEAKMTHICKNNYGRYRSYVQLDNAALSAVKLSNLKGC